MLAQADMVLLALAALAGISFSVIGAAYRLGQDRGVSTAQVALVMALAGVCLFGWRCRNLDWQAVPWQVWAWGAVTGLSQFALVGLFRLALDRGPLTPMWCSTNLSFLIVIAYSGVILGEGVGALQLVGVGAGIACVIVASMAQSPPAAKADRADSPAPSGVRGAKATYGVILILVLLTNGVTGVAMKDLRGHGPADADWMEVYGSLFSLLLYAGMGLPLAISQVRRGLGGAKPIAWIWVGSMAAAGSVLGMLASCASTALPAATGFTVTNSTSILGAAVLSVGILSEKIRWHWWATTALALVTLALAQLPMLMGW